MTSRRIDTFQGSTAESAIGAVLAALMLAALGGVIGELMSGTVTGALEGAGVILFATAVIAAPFYIESVRRRDDG